MRILFAEDNRDLSRAVSTLLTRAGYGVDAVYDGEDALEYAQNGDYYDLLVLDVMMPKIDGMEVARRLRALGVSTPALLLTAKDQLADKIAGLDAGADDYLTKPFETGELLARVRALLRRRGEFAPDILRFGDLSLDKTTFELSCGEKKTRLTGKAFGLMACFMEAPGSVLSVNHLMEKVWGWDAEAEINVVWVNVSFLRKKLAELGSRVEIRVLRGAGYALGERL